MQFAENIALTRTIHFIDDYHTLPELKIMVVYRNGCSSFLQSDAEFTVGARHIQSSQLGDCCVVFPNQVPPTADGVRGILVQASLHAVPKPFTEKTEVHNQISHFNLQLSYRLQISCIFFHVLKNES